MMADLNVSDTGRTLFQLRAASAEKNLASAESIRQGDGSGGEGLEKASQQFESLLLNFMIREMRSTVPESGLFPRSMAEEMYTSMLDEELAGVMAERGGIGISRMLIDQLSEIKTDK
jgi:flagellar protein FlgJ